MSIWPWPFDPFCLSPDFFAICLIIYPDLLASALIASSLHHIDLWMYQLSNFTSTTSFTVVCTFSPLSLSGPSGRVRGRVRSRCHQGWIESDTHTLKLIESKSNQCPHPHLTRPRLRWKQVSWQSTFLVHCTLYNILWRSDSWTKLASGMRFVVNRTHPDRRVGLIGLYGGNVAVEIRSTGL